MIKTVLAFLVALVLAVGGGAASLAYMLDDTIGAGAVKFGPWTAFRSIGSADADPYSRARISREGLLALGEGEGLAFIADRDSSGQKLRFECAYRIVGPLPAARFWTMYAETEAETPQVSGAIQSRAVLRQADNSVVVAVGKRAAPGNWLRVSGDGFMRVVVTLYDFSMASQSEADDAFMPRIEEAGCDA